MTLYQQIQSEYPIVLIDTGYVNFYSLYATEFWFKLACRDIPEPEKDWMDSVEFIEKYEKMYLARFEKLFTKASFQAIPSISAIKQSILHKLDDEQQQLMAQKRISKSELKKMTTANTKKRKQLIKIPFSQFIFALDCPRKNIWRQEFFKTYKANRDVIYKKDTWKGGGIMGHTCRTLLPKLADIYKFPIIGEPAFEGDDVIALTHRYIRQNFPQKSIIIITNDHDMLQLIDGKTSLMNLKGVNLIDKSKGDSRSDLLMKILCGDPSDNIKSCFPKCGKKTAMRFIREPHKLEEKLNSNPKYRENFNFNQKLIDFKFIPTHLVKAFYEHKKSFFNPTL
jgi:5'-3' exonuclease